MSEIPAVPLGEWAMAKRRLPVLNASGGAAPEPDAQGGTATWAAVAFFCALLTWLPLAAIVSRLADAALEATLPGRLSPANTTRVALTALTLAHLAAYATSLFAGAYVVGRFGEGARARSVYLGEGVLVGTALTFVGAGSWRVGIASAAILVPVGFASARAGFRRGRGL